MAYTGNYTLSDTAAIIGDLMGTIMVALKDNASDLVNVGVAAAFIALLGIILRQLGGFTRVRTWLKV